MYHICHQHISDQLSSVSTINKAGNGLQCATCKIYKEVNVDDDETKRLTHVLSKQLKRELTHYTIFLKKERVRITGIPSIVIIISALMDDYNYLIVPVSNGSIHSSEMQ